MRVRLKKLEEMYRDASPLTRLPGGMAIEHQLRNSLDRKEPIALCVMDIDNFKSFNDRYGYAHGNMVIKETAKIVEQATRTHGKRTDFVGHIGGDDFVVITGPDSIDAVCTEIIRQFDQKAPHFYNDEDRRKGYLLGKNRQGVETKFPLVTISIAIVTNRQRTFDNPLEISEAAAELKDYAKTFPQSLYVVDKRRAESVYR
jgi:diguanylate cyclase (GGDEF)-like protein